MSLLESFDRRSDLFSAAELVPAPVDTWRTPDGRTWTPQQVLRGWQRSIADHWACVTLHRWIKSGLVDVQHLVMPTPLSAHAADDPAWRFVSTLGRPTSREDLEPDDWLGRADLRIEFDTGEITLVEFGTCSPAKMVWNIGATLPLDRMIVAYNCDFAFIFRARTGPLLQMPEVEDVH